MSSTNTSLRSFRRATQLGLVAAALATCAGTAFAVPLVYNLGTMPGGTYSTGGIVSGDGNTVTGYGNTTITGGGSPVRPFRWVLPGPMQVVPLTVSSEGRGISFNGQHIVGFISAGNTPFRWTLAGGFTALNLLPGGTTAFANSTSSNSSASAGYGGSTSGNRAIRWNSVGTPLSLGILTGATSTSTSTPGSYAFGISADGSAVVGTADWAPGVSYAFRWNMPFGPMISLGTLPGGYNARAVAISTNNSTIVGYSDTTGSSGNPRAFRLKAPLPMQNLGVIAGSGTNSIIYAAAVSGNGSRVVGRSYDSTFGNRAFLWMGSTGMLDLRAHITSLGGNVTGWTFEEANGISSDGTAISGSGTFNGQARAFLIKGLPCLDPIASWFPNTDPVGICADPAWPNGSGPNLPAATATITIDSDGSDPLEHAWFVTIGQPAGTAPQPITGPVFADAQTGLTFSIEGWTTPTINISNLRPGQLSPQIWIGGTVTNPCGTITTTLRELRVSPTCSATACSVADIAGGGLAGSTPDGIVDGTDFILFINSFSTGEVTIDALADIAGGGIDGLRPDGIIDGSDFIAFINAFAAGC